MYTLSIIVAIFNRRDELFELLESLSVQSDKDFEIIIVDDGSEVELWSVIEVFNKKLNIYYFKKENSGPGLSRNYGAKRANNDWLIFLDSDVVVEPDYIKNIKENLRKNPTDAFGGADKANDSFTSLQKAISYSMTSIFTTGGIRGSKKSVGKFQPRSFNMGVNKKVFLEMGGFSEMRIGEDPDLSMTLWEKAYTTQFYENIAVFHKRRTSISKFSKQVYEFGVARPILNFRHPQYSKLTFWFPSFFLLGLVFSVLCGGFLNFWIFLGGYLLYFLIVFLHASLVNQSMYIGILSVMTTMVQMFSYGKGFLESWTKINVLKKAPKEAFPTHFYINKN